MVLRVLFFVRLNNPGKSRGLLDFVYVPFFYLTYILNYNPGQNSRNNKAVARQMEASFLPLPPGALLTLSALCNQVFNCT